MTLKIGDVVFYKTHPYTANDQEIKISAYVDYTSPILIVNKKLEGRSYDPATGKDIGEMVECIYYSSNEGKFIPKRIHSKELIKCDTPVSKERKTLLENIDIQAFLEKDKRELTIKNIESVIKEVFLHDKVTLRSVDLELHKHKVSREKENGELIETNHLEFLPPVMTIIGFRYCDDKNKFCNKTGIPLIELKCKWYNSKLKTFSEEFFNVGVLYKINLHHDIKGKEGMENLLVNYRNFINSNFYHSVELKEYFDLEEYVPGGVSNETNEDLGTSKPKVKKVTIKNTLVQIEDIIYKHYFYEALVSDLLQNRKTPILIKKINSISDNVLWGEKFPDYLGKKNTNIFLFDFKEESYYYISYSDRFNKLSRRVVRVRDVTLFVSDKVKLLEHLGLDKQGLTDENSALKELLDSNAHHFLLKLGLENGKVGLSARKGATDIVCSNKLLFNDYVNVFLEANCLLKKGKIRHFKLDGIYEAKEIIDGANWFEADIATLIV